MTTIHHVNTPAALRNLAALLSVWADDNAWLAWDIETRSDVNNLEERHASSRIISVSFSPSPDEAWVVPLSHPSASWAARWKDAARYLFDLVGGRLVAQNGKFDVRWVRHHTGIDLSPYLAWDTMDASYTLDENQPKGLKTRAVEDVGVEPWGDIDLKDAELVEWDELAHYNALDTMNTYRLHEWQREQLKAQPTLGRVFWTIAMPGVRALSRVEHNGMLLDIQETKARKVEAERHHAELGETLLATVPEALLEKPEDVAKSTKWPSWSPNSKFFKAYAEHHWPVLECSQSCEKHGKKGKKPHPQPSWDKSVLKRLKARGFENAGTLLEYRRWDTQLKTYLRPWPKDVTHNGRLHATYKTTSTVTGRLSCERPNLQNVDRLLKSCFKAPKGYRFVQVDYSQIELRIAAHVSGDPAMIQAYQEGEDIHVKTACYAAQDQALRTTELLLLRSGLPANRSGAEVLRALWDHAPTGIEPEAFLGDGGEDRPDQESRRREWGSPDRSIESSMEGWGISSAAEGVSEGFLRAVREYHALGGPSQGPEPGEQHPLELRDALSLLPRFGTPALLALSPAWGELRQKAKAIGFGFLYGQLAKGFVNYARDIYNVTFTVEEAEDVRTKFFEAYPGLIEYHNIQRRRVRKHKQVESIFGRVRRLPNIDSANQLDRWEAERQAINAPIQSAASDLLLLSLARMDDELDPGEARIVGTVHDSILLEVRDDVLDPVIQTVGRIMTDPESLWPGRRLTVPLQVEFEVGSRWGDPEKHTYTMEGAA